MSKTKQKSIDELLKEALVPEDEQPYQVPENWVWVRLGTMFEQEKEQIQPTGTEKYIGLEHLLSGGGISEVGDTQEVKSKKVVFKKGDVLYGKLRPYLNKHATVDFEGVASTDIIVYRSQHLVSNKLLDIFLGLPYVIRYANENSKGINLPRVSPKAMSNLPFPLPPLNEQKRIVDKIERLFAKIDEAKRLIEEVKGSVELRRAAILESAIRGELGTNDPFEAPNQINEKEIVPPNEQPYKVPENWVWVKLKSCLKNLQYGYTASSSASEEGPKYLRITDIQNSRVDWEKVPHCKIDEEQLEKYRLNKGDIVIARTGATTGKSFLIDDVPCAVFASYLIRLTTNDYLDSRYLWNYLKSPMYWKQITVVQKGIAQPGANAQIIGGLSLPLPPVREQQRIAEKVDFLLNKLDSEKQLALEIEQKIDLIKQSILSKAFRGELGTNDPNDEHAIELLKEVLLQPSGQS
ncbi:MAG: restriction endonuclease subunit S [Anoxybacillus gonensis]|nr:restriction endonuclease subunit S [Anoxybacillus gonensis]